MTDANETPATPPSHIVKDGDPLLGVLVKTINGVPGLEVGITLSIGPTMVTGQLCSGKAYLEGVAKDFEDSGKGKPGQPIAETFAEAVRAFAEKAYGPERDDRPVSYIHLRDARHFLPGAQGGLPTKGTWWRGKLSSVDGFSFGVLQEG